MNKPSILLETYKLNDHFTLKNRILMAPMTRAMGQGDDVPISAMADYYARRAAAGLIITEGIFISPAAKNMHKGVGIYNPEQVAAWRRVTDAVHENNGLIFSQLWHVGRVSHPSFLNEQLPLAPSVTTMTGRLPRGDGLTFGQSRAATIAEIKELVVSYAHAAKNARAAGFDGVEIHGANGYLIDQFLHYHTNHRQDDYGNTPENMARFVLEIINACAAEIGYERIGLRLSPGGFMNEIVGDVRDAVVFKYLFAQLNKLPIAYVHTGNNDDSKKFVELDNKSMSAFIRSHYNGTVIACGGYTAEIAQTAIEKNEFNLVAIGRPFIANPDFVQRLHQQQSIRDYDISMLNTLY